LANTDFWTADLRRKVVSRRTFRETPDGPAIWSADGLKVFFYNGEGIHEIASNGTGSEKGLLKTQPHHMHASPDGKYIVFNRGFPSSGLDVLDLSTGKVFEFLTGQVSHAQFSSDSRLVAYESEEMGRAEVYVQSFPAGKGNGRSP
jgi:Tol biopolymer transport system component